MRSVPGVVGRVLETAALSSVEEIGASRAVVPRNRTLKNLILEKNFRKPSVCAWIVPRGIRVLKYVFSHRRISGGQTLGYPKDLTTPIAGRE